LGYAWTINSKEVVSSVLETKYALRAMRPRGSLGVFAKWAWSLYYKLIKGEEKGREEKGR
jgi:hypothetical protein